MKTIEAMTEATDPIGVNKVVAESLTEVPKNREGASKIIIGGNTKAIIGNSTPPTEAITTIIIMVIIEEEVDMAMVVIITEVTIVGEAVIEALQLPIPPILHT